MLLNISSALFIHIDCSKLNRLFKLQILEKVKITYDLPIVTDVHESHQVSFIFRLCSIVQICNGLMVMVNSFVLVLLVDIE